VPDDEGRALVAAAVVALDVVAAAVERAVDEPPLSVVAAAAEVAFGAA
jgi:hypothetical protein